MEPCCALKWAKSFFIHSSAGMWICGYVECGMLVSGQNHSRVGMLRCAGC